MPIDIGNLGEVQRIFVGNQEVQTVRTESAIRYMAFTNTAPFLMALTADVANPSSNQTVTFTATVMDMDVPPQTLDYVWTVNGTVMRTESGTTSLTDTFTHSASGTSATIGCTVTDSAGDPSATETISRTWAGPSILAFLGSYSHDGPDTAGNTFRGSGGTQNWSVNFTFTNNTGQDLTLTASPAFGTISNNFDQNFPPYSCGNCTSTTIPNGVTINNGRCIGNVTWLPNQPPPGTDVTTSQLTFSAPGYVSYTEVLLHIDFFG